MREILFRGKAINRNKGYHRTKYKNGDWVYGLLTRSYDELFENLPAEMTNEHGVSGIEVDYKTIGQYTGLTDKNGNKIFEGDIVITNKFGTPQKKYVIGFDEEIATYIGEGKKGCARYFTTFSGDADCFEVIGNIHDNPELLKGGAE